jgi:hypothetical protein
MLQCALAVPLWPTAPLAVGSTAQWAGCAMEPAIVATQAPLARCARTIQPGALWMGVAREVGNFYTL